MTKTDEEILEVLKKKYSLELETLKLRVGRVYTGYITAINNRWDEFFSSLSEIEQHRVLEEMHFEQNEDYGRIIDEVDKEINIPSNVFIDRDIDDIYVSSSNPFFSVCISESEQQYPVDYSKLIFKVELSQQSEAIVLLARFLMEEKDND